MQFQDRLAEEAFIEIAALLATAYQRYVVSRPVASERPDQAPASGLAMSRLSSPHEGAVDSKEKEKWLR